MSTNISNPYFVAGNVSNLYKVKILNRIIVENLLKHIIIVTVYFGANAEDVYALIHVVVIIPSCLNQGINYFFVGCVVYSIFLLVSALYGRLRRS